MFTTEINFPHEGFPAARLFPQETSAAAAVCRHDPFP